MIRVFIQARMSSQRFPGKVLAPLGGRPILKHLLEQVARVFPLNHVTVVTSVEPSDDPLACYVRNLGVAVYRGELENVAARFQGCLREYPCDWFVRLCADSPLLNPVVLKAVATHPHCLDFDIVTNVYPRTFPKGHSVEMVRAEVFADLNVLTFTADEREHVTAVFYHYPQRFRILNLTSDDPRQADLSLVVDTVDDLRCLEMAWHETARVREARQCEEE